MRTLLIPVLALALAGCGSDASTADADREDSEPEAPAPAVDCISTPESDSAITDGLTVQGGGSLRNAQAVSLSAGDFGFLHVVAAEIDGPGMEGDGDIGTWAVGELGGGPIVAANSLAQEFSEWGAAATDGSPMDVARDAVATSAEAEAAEACVSGG